MMKIFAVDVLVWKTFRCERSKDQGDPVDNVNIIFSKLSCHVYLFIYFLYLFHH